MTRVLVTGGAGYIGSTLVSMLVEKGYRVRVLDVCYFGQKPLSDVIDKIDLIKNDIRTVNHNILDGIDAVIDMAAISNDPSGELNPISTFDINWIARSRIANLAKLKGVDRYLLASSCSVYGFQDGILSETSPTNPLTTYAKSNVLWENDALKLADKKFSVTSLRQATVYGLSKRMRFDLAINTMVLSCFKDGNIVIDGDGTQYRPFVHVRDTASVFIKVLEADKEEINGEIFNVGSNEQNFEIKNLARTIANAISSRKKIKIEFNSEKKDKRSYRVEFGKIKKMLNFRPKYTPQDGAREIYDALSNGTLRDELKMHTVNWLKSKDLNITKC